MKFDDRKKAAILAGLRLLQAAQDYTLPWKLSPPQVSRGRLCEIESIFTDDDNLMCLYPDEIDKLCERINVPHPEPDAGKMWKSAHNLRERAAHTLRYAEACATLGLGGLHKHMLETVRVLNQTARDLERYLEVTT